MLDDEAFNRKMLAQLTFKLEAKTIGDGAGEDLLQLRTLVKEMDKQFPTGKKLHAAKTAASGPVELAYCEYSRFSLDAVHCSVTVLGRHISSRDAVTGRELIVTDVPETPPREVLSTIVGVCRAMIFAVVGANDLLGGVGDRARLAAIVDEFDAINQEGERSPRAAM